MALARSTYRLGMVALLALWAVACSSEETLPQLDVDPETSVDERRAGTLWAEYAIERDGRPGGLSVHAQFLDVRGINYETALEALEVWSPDWQLDADSCSLRARPSVAQEEAENIRLQLLDVGPIRVEGPEQGFELEARRLPDLMSAFSGVIYGTEPSFGTRNVRVDYRPGSHYGFGAPGRADSGGFEVALQAPAPVAIASLAGQPTAGATRMPWDFSADLPMEWQPAEAGADGLFLDITSGFGPDRPRLQCRLEDDGAFVVPAAILEQLAGDDAALELSLRRINATSAEVDGLESAEFIFSSVDQISLIGR